MQESQQSQQQEILLPVAHQNKSRTLEKYKRRLLFQVIAIFTICLLIILERIFYQVITESEDKTLSSLQVSSDLIIHDEDDYLPNEITNGFLSFLGTLSNFRYQFLILTHLLVTFYVAVDSLMTSKILYTTMALIYLISLLQLFYGGQRPFWSTNSILASGCMNGYSHPYLGFILMMFLPYYTFYCWKKKSGELFVGIMKTKEIVLSVVIFVIVGVIQFINYLTGMVYLINLALSIICFLLLMMIMISINSPLDQIIKKSTIIQVDAKKYVFYWLLFICLLMTFILIVYSGQQVFLDIDWVRNYISCTDYHHYEDVNYRYDEVVGPWFNFLQTATLFAWIGAVFGISFSFNRIGTPEWCQGSAKQRIMRALIANVLVIPSWLFIIFLEKGTWIKDIGLNEFIVDCVHYFILYIWLFGGMPVLLLHKLLKITGGEKEDYYVVMPDRKRQIEA